MKALTGRRAGAALAIVVTGLLAGGCGGSLDASSGGVNVTCSAFHAMNRSGQRALVQRVLRSHHLPGGSAAADPAILVVDGYCAINGGGARVGRLFDGHWPLG